MLFVVNYSSKAHGDEGRDRRVFKLLAAWKPPAGFDMKGWYDLADGSGGFAIVESGSAEVLLEALGPWAVFLDFSVRPIVPVEKSTPIFGKGIAWRDSVK